METVQEINEVVERFKAKGMDKALDLINGFLKDGGETHDLAHDIVKMVETFKLGDSVKALESKVENLFDEVQREYNYEDASCFEQEEAEKIYGILKPYTEDLYAVIECNHEVIK
jgi:hypothetical protein